MSSSASLTNLLPPTPQQPTASSRLLTPTTLPIPLLNNPLSRNYQYAHTAIILLYYYVRSGALVTEPLGTMAQDLVVIALLQSVFCALCLPSKGKWNDGMPDAAGAFGNLGKGAKTGKISGAGSMRKRGGLKASGLDAGVGGSLGSRIMPTLLSLILAVTLPPVPLTILALCLGAPLYPTTLIPHTLALSVHVSFLGFLPLFYTHGVSASAWRDVSAVWLPFDESGVWAGTVGCLVGGWVGAVPIALDWDREWQKWPCTVLWGVVIGWGVGRLMTGGGLRWGIGKRINLSEKEEQPMSLEPESQPGVEEKKKS